MNVLIGRSYTITPQEILFWLWSFGFIIDEIPGFNESGISLYFMSMWNGMIIPSPYGFQLTFIQHSISASSCSL